MPAKPANDDDEPIVMSCGECGSPNFWLYDGGAVICGHCDALLANGRWFDPNEPPPEVA